jgi:uncharacterized alkaline shock family protein YloU
MSQDWRAERLPCGRELGAIVEQVVDGHGDDLDDHQRTCRYCQAALEDTERLWTPVRGFVAEPLEVPDELIESLVRRVRRLVALGWITLSRTARGITRASGWIVAAIAEAVADATPGVSRVGSSAGRVVDALAAARPAGTGEQSATGGRAVEVGEQQAAIDLDLVPEYGPSILDVADRVRRNVRAEVAELTGLDVVEVNVRVRDVDARV